MNKYVYIYYGSGEPTQEVMSAWTGWFEQIAGHIVDSGNPFGQAREVTRAQTRELTADMHPASGYTIVNADTIDEAVKLLDGCPIIDSVRVYEAVSM